MSNPDEGEKDQPVELNDGGTPLLDADTAHVPEAREDIPPMQRIGMPLYDPDLYEVAEPKDTTDTRESDPKAHSEDVRSGRGASGKAGATGPSARGEGRV